MNRILPTPRKQIANKPQKKLPPRVLSPVMRRAKSKKRLAVWLAALSGSIAIFTICYTLFVFSNIPFIAYWRGIWIETAMTTGHHHWLAEAFIPGETIDLVMSAAVENPDIIGGGSELKPSSGNNNTGSNGFPKVDDILGQKSLTVGGKDYAGNTVLINDIDEGLVVSEIVGASFKGKIMLIDDPSRVYLGMTPTPGAAGLRIRAMMEEYDAIAGINASGFNDPYENGNGSEVVGISCSCGSYWGTYVDYYGSVVLTDDNHLVVGNISIWENYNIRDGIQFGPVLIADGAAQVSGSSGYGIQPRTAIGQREDGVIVFLIIDGRDVTHSVGCTVGDMVDILLDYDIINAACCDGGASSVLAYNGEVINKNCSLNPAFGRPLPNAFLVKKKADS